MPDDPTDSRTRATTDIDAGWGALLDGIGNSGPLVVASEPVATTASDPEPAIVDPSPKVAEPSGAGEDRARTAVRRHIGDDAPLLLDLGTNVPQPIDASTDAPRVLETVAAVPRPIETNDESWPRREPVEIVARTTDSQRAARAASAPTRRASTAEIQPPAARSSWKWFAGAAAVVGAIGWFATRPSVESPAAETPGATSTAAPMPRATKPADVPPATERSAAPVVVDSPRAAEAIAPAPAPAPATATTIEGTPAEVLAAASTALGEGRFGEAHALADRAWDGARTNEAVRVMALAACEMQDGALARDAFRKLEGPPLRSEAYVLCKRRGIDVRAKIDGYTPRELLAMAHREAAQGDHEKAYERARASNRLAKSADALQLMAQSACHNKDADAAAYLIAMLPRDRQREVEAVCTSAGTTLPEAGSQR